MRCPAEVPARRPADSALYQVIETHLGTFLAHTAGDTEASGLPVFVKREFEAYLRCGILAHGEAIASVLGAIRHQVGRWLARRGLAPGAEPAAPDGLAEISPVLAQIMSASVQGRVALGRHAGARVERLGGEPPEHGHRRHGPRQAHLDGFDLHADVRVPPQ